MIDPTNEEWTADDVFYVEVSDESLEAAASAGSLGLYTQFAFCTMNGCPG